MRSQPDTTVVIGYGNPLRGDGGAGFHVATELRRGRRNAIPVPQLGPELVDEMAGAGRVVFVDADVATLPGTTRLERITAERALRLGHASLPACSYRSKNCCMATRRSA
jgi:hydrogenase maturation protease